MEIFIHIPKFKRKKPYNYRNSVVIIYADRVGVRDVWDARKLIHKWGLMDAIIVTRIVPTPNVEKQAILKDITIEVSSDPKKRAKVLKHEYDKKGIPCFIKSIEDVTERNFTMDPM